MSFGILAFSSSVKGIANKYIICSGLNSDNPNFKGYGHKIAEIEKIVKNIKNEYHCTYKDAVEVFKNLISSGKIRAEFDDETKGIEFKFAVDEIDALMKVYGDWERGKDKN